MKLAESGARPDRFRRIVDLFRGCESNDSLKIGEVGDFGFAARLFRPADVLKQRGKSDHVDTIEIAREIMSDRDFVGLERSPRRGNVAPRELQTLFQFFRRTPSRPPYVFIDSPEDALHLVVTRHGFRQVTQLLLRFARAAKAIG